MATPSSRRSGQKLGTTGRLFMFAIVVVAGLAAQPATNPPMTGYVSYATYPAAVPSNIPAYCAWINAHFKIQEATAHGVDCTAYRGTGNVWATYIEGTGIYSNDIYPFIFGVAARNGWINPEGLLLHMTADYKPTPFGYVSADQFDIYERSSINLPSTATHGVMNGATDVTAAAYSGTSPFTVSGKLTIGDQIPFDTINLTVNTPRVGKAVAYQYWNGTSYATLTTASDTTSGLMTTGTITFLPPADWVPNIDGGTFAKYHVRFVVSGGGKSPVIAKITGDDLLTGGLNRGWNACAGGSGHINMGTPVEYCGSPAAGHTAKFLQQARAMNGYMKMGFVVNPGNIDIPSGTHTMPLVQAARTAAALAASPRGYNGVMFDDVGAPLSQAPRFAHTNSDLDSTGSAYTSWTAAQTASYQRTHTLLTATYGPRWWDGANVYAPPKAEFAAMDVAMNWTLSETYDLQSDNLLNMITTDQPLFCTDIRWCPAGLPSTPNSNGTIELWMARDNQIRGINDGSGTALANDHLWDMANRGPMSVLAGFLLARSDKIALAYNTLGFTYANVGDDYYYFRRGTATLAGAISPAVCTASSPCTIPLTGTLGASCPKIQGPCALRIGGTDIVVVSNYTGTSLTATVGFILNSYAPGATIEAAYVGHQSVDTMPPASQMYYYGAHFPAMDYDYGVPDATNGFNYPCSGTYLGNKAPAISGTPPHGCWWLSGTAVSSYGCKVHCAPVVRRDFSGGTSGLGYVIVLARPSATRNDRTASLEWDTYSAPIALGGTYYPLKADGTFGAATTTATLRGGEAGVYVQNLPGAAPSAKAGKQISR